VKFHAPEGGISRISAYMLQNHKTARRKKLQHAGIV